MNRRHRAGPVRRLAPLVLVLVLGAAAPAAADPAGPTHYQSRVTSVEGAQADAVAVETLGGDAFLVLHVRPGATVEVPGYDGEPYVRVGADGTVEVNERAPTRWLNDERYGVPAPALPAAADADAPPQWRVAAEGGTYAWHDHRIHWMSPGLPPHVDPRAGTPQRVWEWSLPLVVNGAPVAVHGELDWLPGPSPLATGGATLALFAGALALLLARPGARPLLVAVAVAATTAAGLGHNLGLPPGADGEPATVILPAVAAALLVAGVVSRRAAAPRRRLRDELLVAAAGVPLVVWGLTQVGALTRPVLAGALPAAVERAVAMSALGVGVAVLVSGVVAALRATALDAGEEVPRRAT